MCLISLRVQHQQQELTETQRQTDYWQLRGESCEILVPSTWAEDWWWLLSVWPEWVGKQRWPLEDGSWLCAMRAKPSDAAVELFVKNVVRCFDTPGTETFLRARPLWPLINPGLSGHRSQNVPSYLMFLWLSGDKTLNNLQYKQFEFNRIFLQSLEKILHQSHFKNHDNNYNNSLHVCKNTWLHKHKTKRPCMLAVI